MKDVSLVRTVTIGENIESVDFSFGKRRENSMGLIVEEGEETEQREGDQMQVKDEVGDEKEPMYLAAGLGFDSIDFQAATTGEAAPLLDFDESGDLEEYYRKMLDQFPSHPLFLRNYAHLLQSKGDLHSAEEYYQRAILVEPEDGEILMHYAKLVWELYHDRDRAKGFFERATQAAPNDSQVLAAYASFLWETEEDDDEETDPSGQFLGSTGCEGAMVGAAN
ncbi:hypothetical protein LINPERPRIM_LOCUS16865 [Linum perenne]